MSKLTFKKAEFTLSEPGVTWRVEYLNQNADMRYMVAYLYKNNKQVYISEGHHSNATDAKALITFYKESHKQ